MLSPRRANRPLMPQDREVIRLLGITASEYREFLEGAEQLCRMELMRPGPKAFIINPLTLFIINLVVGIALSLAAAALAPKPSGRPPEQKTREVEGKSLVGGDVYAAKSGFNSSQNLVELGSIIPLVYANREILDGIAYGGVRVNTDLLWSQMLSLGGNQLFRGILLIGQGGVQEIDPQQLAIGDALLSGYGLNVGGQLSSKITIYSRMDGGRITSNDQVAGVPAEQDDGNSERAGAPDVFCVHDQSNTLSQWFSYTSRQSSQTTFGVYAPIGSCLSYRYNPQFSPGIQVFLRPIDNGENYRVKCPVDPKVRTDRMKMGTAFHGRTYFPALPDGRFFMNVGEEVELLLSRESDYEHVFKYKADGPDGRTECTDVGQVIGGRQQGYDDALVVGERYMIGSAIALCISRSENPFISNANLIETGSGQSVTAVFRVLESGSATNKLPYDELSDSKPTLGLCTATSHAQVFKVAIATVALERKAQVIEVGIRSTLGISINGLCNFNTTWSFEKSDEEFCLKYEDDENDSDQPFNNMRFQNGTLSINETRFSFWRVRYRRAGSNDEFFPCPALVGTSSNTQQAMYTYLRIVFPSFDNWEFQFVPVSGWEVRTTVPALYLLDFRAPMISVQNGGLFMSFSGRVLDVRRRTFRSTYFENAEALGLETDSGSYVDGWAKLAETFIYNEVQSSAQGGAEHEISYVNVFSEQDPVPVYDNLAILGLSMRAGPEIRELGQISVPVMKGLQGTHLFPEVYADMLTNPEYASRGVISPEQIDWDSFAEAAAWTRERRYFCDIGQSEPINRRDWGQTTANRFLLDLVTRNGKLVLQQTFYLDRPEPITALFTGGNTVEDSFTYRTANSDAVQPVRVSVRWRQERQTTTLGERALFPVIREVTVARKDTPGNARVVRLDLTDLCTSEKHAIDVGKIECLTPELARSFITFRTWPQAGTIIPGRSFQLGMESVTYESPANGLIAGDGSVTSWPPLADGTYEVALWRSGGSLVEETSLTITGGKSGPANAVFCLRSATQLSPTYKAVRVALNDDAEVEVEAVEFPCDAQGFSLYADGFDDPDRWEIDGRIA
jgi:hypothetical protein